MKYIAIILLSVLLSSCAITVRQLQTTCATDAASVFRNVTPAMLDEGYKVTMSDTSIGLLQAETRYVTETTGQEKWVWTLKFEKGILTAYCRRIIKTTNNYGKGTSAENEAYIDDSYFTGEKRYWSVRKAISTLCSGDVKWIESKKDL